MERNHNKVLLLEYEMEFHELDTSPSYKDVIQFQGAERTNKGGRTAFMLRYEGKPKYDEQIKAIIAQKMPRTDDTRLQKYGYFTRRSGDDLFARDKSEHKRALEGLTWSTKHFIFVNDQRNTLISWGNFERFINV